MIYDYLSLFTKALSERYPSFVRSVRRAWRKVCGGTRHVISRPFNWRRKMRQLAGCVRYLALALTWNLLPLGSIAFLAVLMTTDQGLELLKIDRVISPGIGEQFLKVGAPLLLYTVSVALASITLARAGARRLGDLALRYDLSANVMERVSRVFIPL